MPLRATSSNPLFSLGTGRTRSFSPAAAVTFAVAFTPLSLVTGDPATVLFRIFFLLAVANAVITWIAVTAAKFLPGLPSSLFHVAAPLCGERTKVIEHNDANLHQFPLRGDGSRKVFVRAKEKSFFSGGSKSLDATYYEICSTRWARPSPLSKSCSDGSNHCA